MVFSEWLAEFVEAILGLANFVVEFTKMGLDQFQCSLVNILKIKIKNVNNYRGGYKVQALLTNVPYFFQNRLMYLIEGPFLKIRHICQKYSKMTKKLTFVLINIQRDPFVA